MKQTRRDFLSTATCVMGATTILPFRAQAAGESGDKFATNGGEISINPVAHASFVMKTPIGTIYNDPVGDVAAYVNFPPADLILITHEHGDHFKLGTLSGLAKETTKLIANPAVFAKLPDDLKAKSTSIGNGQSSTFNGMKIDAIPAYNTTAGREKFHPQGRDNGYVLEIDGIRVYISGDTEDIGEMRALTNIDVAFVCMNLPFTMDVAAAASAVVEFKPKFVYPYHYRGRDNGTQDPAEFAKLVGEASTVKLAPWYG